MAQENVTEFRQTPIIGMPTTGAMLQRQSAYGQHTAVGGECEACKIKSEGTLQRAAINSELMPEVPPIIHEVLRSSGQPLDSATRAFMEPRFGRDFSGVRVHTNTSAATSARAVNARAYAVAQDVVFGEGHYAPHTSAGRYLLGHELAHVVQQQASSNGRDLHPITVGGEHDSAETEADSVAQRLTQGDHQVSTHVVTPRQIHFQRGPEVRFPTLEVAALRSQGAFALGGSPLTSSEISAARSVFGNSINLAAVRIVYTPVISAPTTLGNTIRVPPSYAMPLHVLIHELTHIWQYQTKGSAYISDSAFHQTAATITSLVTTGRIDRSGAYGYDIVPGQSLHNYTAEQQALIVENYYAYPTLRADPEYQHLIAEVRAASPIVAPQSFFEEMAAGLPPRQFALPPSPRGAATHEDGFVPQLELRF